MAGFTNRGKMRMLEMVFRNQFNGGNFPNSFYVVLLDNATTISPDTKTMTEVNEIATGNGYNSGGIALQRNSTDFDILSEDDIKDTGSVQAKDITWTATGGPIPSSGNPIRYLAITDDNPVVSSREIIAYKDLGEDITISAGGSLTIKDITLTLEE